MEIFTSCENWENIYFSLFSLIEFANKKDNNKNEYFMKYKMIVYINKNPSNKLSKYKREDVQFFGLINWNG